MRRRASFKLKSLSPSECRLAQYDGVDLKEGICAPGHRKRLSASATPRGTLAFMEIYRKINRLLNGEIATWTRPMVNDRTIQRRTHSSTPSRRDTLRMPCLESGPRAVIAFML